MMTHSDSKNSDSGPLNGKIQIKSYSNISIKNCGGYENMVWVPYEQVFLAHHKNLLVVRCNNIGFNIYKNIVHAPLECPKEPKNINRYLLKLVIPEDRVQKKLLNSPKFMNFRNNMKTMKKLNQNSFRN